MPEDKKFFFINIFLIFVVLIEGLWGLSIVFQKQIKIPSSKNSFINPLEQNNASELQIFYEKIPGSRFHGPDATWWGYNQNKIVRYGKYVFMYMIDNIDDKNTTLSKFVVYKKDRDNPWEKGASFPTSRPGNILIDSQGVLHAFVFEPFNAVKNDSWGKLKHYWFPYSAKGDITSYKEEIIVDNDGTNETVNIRIGAAAGIDGTLAIAFGMGRFNNLYKDFSEHLFFKKPLQKTWTHLISGENLGHEYYYPFVWVEKENFYLLPVQDDWNGQGTPQLPYPNIYQKIMYFFYQNGAWKKELIADLSKHPLAKTRPRLLEQEDLYIDKNGAVHILYKEFLNSETQWKTTAHKHVAKNIQGSTEEQIGMGKDNINWIRLFEVNANLYYLYVFYDSAYIKKAETEKMIKLSIPNDAHGMYPYIATRRGGTRDSEAYVDILFLAADKYDFQKGTNVNYYLRIPKTEFAKLK